jgi:hypothetical protein
VQFVLNFFWKIYEKIGNYSAGSGAKKSSNSVKFRENLVNFEGFIAFLEGTFF